MAAAGGAACRRRAAPPLLALAVLLLALAGGAAGGRLDPKGAKITLRAKWPGTPLLHEAAEFLVRACLVLGGAMAAARWAAGMRPIGSRRLLCSQQLL